MDKKTKTEAKEISFEQSFTELQEIVARMEAGDLTLGDSLKSYETGIKRLKECYAALNDAEQKIRQLAEIDADGNLKTTSFETSDGNGGAKPAKSKGRAARKSSGDELF